MTHYRFAMTDNGHYVKQESAGERFRGLFGPIVERRPYFAEPAAFVEIEASIAGAKTPIRRGTRPPLVQGPRVYKKPVCAREASLVWCDGPLGSVSQREAVSLPRWLALLVAVVLVVGAGVVVSAVLALRSYSLVES
jgi:hypothetical protein